MADIDDIKKALEALERLRIEYEKYFIGVETREPEDELRRVERMVRRIFGRQIIRTADRFQVENLRSKWVSLSNYWNRVRREIEEGTYFRHRFRKKLHEEARQDMEQARERAGVSEDGSFDLSAGIEAGIQKPERIYGDLFEQYKNAGANVSYDKLAATLKKQETAIKQKYGAKKVTFSVKIVDGKPKLSAKPIK